MSVVGFQLPLCRTSSSSAYDCGLTSATQASACMMSKFQVGMATDGTSLIERSSERSSARASDRASDWHVLFTVFQASGPDFGCSGRPEGSSRGHLGAALTASEAVLERAGAACRGFEVDKTILDDFERILRSPLGVKIKEKGVQEGRKFAVLFGICFRHIFEWFSGGKLGS